jgi:hypothetical protein
MSLTDLASLGSFVSGVAVAITLIFLVIQMRQNTLAVRAAASQAHSAAYQELSTLVSTSGDLARIWRLGMADIGQLNDDERVRFISYVSSIFRFMESARLQWRHGQLDNQHWYELETEIKDFAMQPGVKAYWALRRRWHAEEFLKWFESLPQAEAVPLFGGVSASDQPTNKQT